MNKGKDENRKFIIRFENFSFPLRNLNFQLVFPIKKFKIINLVLCKFSVCLINFLSPVFVDSEIYL